MGRDRAVQSQQTGADSSVTAVQQQFCALAAQCRAGVVMAWESDVAFLSTVHRHMRRAVAAFTVRLQLLREEEVMGRSDLEEEESTMAAHIFGPLWQLRTAIHYARAEERLFDEQAQRLRHRISDLQR